jgi:hypothetical protein
VKHALANFTNWFGQFGQYVYVSFVHVSLGLVWFGLVRLGNLAIFHQNVMLFEIDRFLDLD